MNEQLGCVFAEGSSFQRSDPFQEHATGKLCKAARKKTRRKVSSSGTVHDEFSWRGSNCAESSSSVVVKYFAQRFLKIPHSAIDFCARCRN
jgi:hypothetical protein